MIDKTICTHINTNCRKHKNKTCWLFPAYLQLQRTNIRHCVCTAALSNVRTFQNLDTPTQDSDVSTCTHAEFAQPYTKSPKAEKGACWLLCVWSCLESSQAGTERCEGGEGGREAGMKGDTAATSHSAHYLIASSPVPRSRSAEEEWGETSCCYCCCVCVQARDRIRGAYLCKDHSLKPMCLQIFNSLLNLNICHTKQCFQYQIT